MNAMPPSLPLNLLPDISQQQTAAEVRENFKSAEAFMLKHFSFTSQSSQNLFSGTQISIAEFLIQQGKLSRAADVILRATKLAAAEEDGRFTLHQCERLTKLIQQKLASGTPANSG